MNSLKIDNLQATIADKTILQGLSLEIPKGEVHAIMDQTEVVKAPWLRFFRHPDYEVIGGTATLNDENLLGLEPDEISRLGLFLAFQYPMEVLALALPISYGQQGMHVWKRGKK